MKKLLGLFLLLNSITLQSQSSFDSGFKKGFCEGYKDKCGAYSSCPSAPSAPSPSAYQSSDSYTDGYNTGFKQGMNRDCRNKGSNGAYANPKYISPIDPSTNDAIIKHRESYKKQEQIRKNNNTEAISTVATGLITALLTTDFKGNNATKLWQWGSEQSDPEIAIGFYTESISKYPRYDGAIYFSRGINYIETGEYEAALSDLNIAYELSSSKFIDLDIFYADICFAKGETKFELGDYDGAILDYNESLKFKPLQHFEKIRNRKAKAEIAINLGLNKALELWNNGKKSSSLDLALYYFSESISMYPKFDGAIYFSRAVTYFEKKLYNKALSDLNIAYKLSSSILKDPDLFYADICFKRGETKFELGDYDGAILDYNESLKFNPKHQELILNKTNLILAQKELIYNPNIAKKETKEKQTSEKVVTKEQSISKDNFDNQHIEVKEKSISDLNEISIFESNAIGGFFPIFVTTDKRFLISSFTDEKGEEYINIYNFKNYEKLIGPHKVEGALSVYSENNSQKIYIMNEKKGLILNVDNLTFEDCKMSWEAQGELMIAGKKAYMSEMQWDKMEPKLIMTDFTITGKGSYIKITPNQ